MRNPRKGIYLHLLLWIVFYAFLVFMFSNLRTISDMLVRAVIFIIPLILLFYFNAYFLFEKYFRPGKMFLYIILLSGASVFTYFFINQLDYYIIALKYPWGKNMSFWLVFMRSALLILGTISLSIAFRSTQIAHQKEKEAAALRNENLETELKFLKSQINPHFLFNALHNIYTLSYLGSKNAPEMILKLSNLLRYMTYEGNKDWVPIEKEIDYLRDYIDLQKLKEEHNGNIQINCDIKSGNIQIPPMLLIPFLENSFKHSKIEDKEKGWIKIELKADQYQLQFFAANSQPGKSYTKDRVGGVGLKNVKRRLDLIYGKNYQMEIKNDSDTFTVDLSIKLSDINPV